MSIAISSAPHSVSGGATPSAGRATCSFPQTAAKCRAVAARGERPSPLSSPRTAPQPVPYVQCTALPNALFVRSSGKESIPSTLAAASAGALDGSRPRSFSSIVDETVMAAVPASPASSPVAMLFMPYQSPDLGREISRLCYNAVVPRARTPHIELHYEARGTGEPPLLLIAGIPAVASDWASLAEPLSARRRVIAYDNRGSGGSTVTPGPYTTRQLAADGIALLDALGIERADVFGMSLGGMIAQELALGWPDRARRLILGCTHAGIAHAARQPRETVRAFSMQTDDWGERMRALSPHAFASDVDGTL